MSAKGIMVACGAALLTGCADDGLADQIARNQARDAINPVLAQRFPGVPLQPATDCVINEASAAEIYRLGRAGTSGLTPQDRQLVIEIATRPDTIKCLLEDGLSPFLNSV